MFGAIFVVLIVVTIFAAGIRIIRPVDRGLVETLGKYSRTANPGFNWIVPVFQKMMLVNVTEQMVDDKPQMIITKDKLNAMIDIVVFYKISNPQDAMYNIDDHKNQLTALSRTTLRAVVGKMSLTECNENRTDINEKIEKVLKKETATYGVNVLRVEIQRIEAPKDVQEAMNEVVKAAQEKQAALDLATATETKADGVRRAAIKEAEGDQQGAILRAKGTAEAIKLVNTSVRENFKDQAVEFRKYEALENAMQNGSKWIVSDHMLRDLSKLLPSVRS